MPALQQRGTRSELSPPARAPSPQPQQTPILRSTLQCGVDQRTQCVAYKTPHAPVSFQPMYVVLCSRRRVATRLASELPTEQAPVWAALYHIQHRCLIEHSRSSATIAVVVGAATRATAGVKARHACLAPSWVSTDFSSYHHFQLQLPDVFLTTGSIFAEPSHYFPTPSSCNYCRGTTGSKKPCVARIRARVCVRCCGDSSQDARSRRSSLRRTHSDRVITLWLR